MFIGRFRNLVSQTRDFGFLVAGLRAEPSQLALSAGWLFRHKAKTKTIRSRATVARQSCAPRFSLAREPQLVRPSLRGGSRSAIR